MSYQKSHFGIPIPIPKKLKDISKRCGSGKFDEFLLEFVSGFGTCTTLAPTSAYKQNRLTIN